MSSLRNNYNQIVNPDGWYIPASTVSSVTGTQNIKVPLKFNFWTVSVVGPDTIYTLSVRAAGMTEFREVEDGIIDGTVAGFVANFEGTIAEIQIVPSTGGSFVYSISGKVQS